MRGVMAVVAGLGAWLVLVGATPSTAVDYQSGFGFRIGVPEIWLVLTRTEVAENATLLLEGDGEDAFLMLDPDVRRDLFERIRGGEVEIFYRREGAVRAFVDNVNVMQQNAELPASNNDLVQLCGLLPEEFSKVFGRPVSIDVCEIRMRLGRRVLYLQFDGVVPGTTSMQYQIERGQGRLLVVTATTADENVSRMLSEFEEMVSSIRLD